jgi:hypothetical protein
MCTTPLQKLPPVVVSSWSGVSASRFVSGFEVFMVCSPDVGWLREVVIAASAPALALCDVAKMESSFDENVHLEVGKLMIREFIS